MFKVGSIVKVNADYIEDDNCFGKITPEVSPWGAHVIKWRDGTIGHVYLKQADKYLTLVK